MKFFPLLIFLALGPSVEATTFESGATQVALVELYTSEGCSSCPPAEAWLESRRDDPGLWKKFVPVAFHVDYWDQLGWPDRFASPEFTRRQRTYAAAWKAESVYTPEFVCNGREWLVRTFPWPGKNVGRLRAEANGREVAISFVPESASGSALVAEVAPLAHDIAVKVRGGENAGRNLTHGFVALGLVSAVMERGVDGGATARITLPERLAAPVAALAVWVHAANDPAPLQATGGWLKN